MIISPRGSPPPPAPVLSSVPLLPSSSLQPTKIVTASRKSSVVAFLRMWRDCDDDAADRDCDGHHEKEA